MNERKKKRTVDLLAGGSAGLLGYFRGKPCDTVHANGDSSLDLFVLFSIRICSESALNEFCRIIVTYLQ